MAIRAAKAAERGLAGLGEGASELFRRGMCARSANPDDGDGGRRPPTGEGKDGGAL